MREEPQPIIERQQQLIDELRLRADQLETAREQLFAAEQANARIPELESIIIELQLRVAAEHAEAARVRREALDLEMRLYQLHEIMADVYSSPSWRLTTPLRNVKHLVRRAGGA